MNEAAETKIRHLRLVPIAGVRDYQDLAISALVDEVDQIVSDGLLPPDRERFVREFAVHVRSAFNLRHRFEVASR